MPGAFAGLLGLVLLLGLAEVALAQQQVAGSAELKRVIGRVEVLRKGQTQWVPAVVGAKLVEGDDIRAFAGASAELELPDASTLLLAENSRIVVTKLEFDQQNQTRLAIFHLAVGKVRAAVSAAAISLVRARQSNFAITTPTAVAAARGTLFEVLFDGNVTHMVVLPGRGPAPSVVTCTAWVDPRATTTVTAGMWTSVARTGGCRTPAASATAPFSSTIGTDRNPFQPGALLSSPVSAVPPSRVPAQGGVTRP
jgi:hypothetical protein